MTGVQTCALPISGMKHYISEIIKCQAPHSTLIDFYIVKYALWYKNSACDGMNIISCVDKFIMDACQETKTVTNDNVKCYIGGEWKVAGRDKVNPRLECFIIPVTKEFDFFGDKSLI